MMKTFLLLLFSSVLSFGIAQSENEIVNISARICQTDSVNKVLGVYDEDSTLLFHMQTPDYDTYGASEYEYEKFVLIYDVGTNLLINQVPFGKIDMVDYGKKKCRMVMEIAGAGDREKAGLWTFAVYDFSRPKGGQWLLDGVKYHFDDYYVGKEID